MLSCVTFLYILGTNPYHIYDLQISPPIQCKLSFHFVSGFLFCVEGFEFDIHSFVYFLFLPLE